MRKLKMICPDCDREHSTPLTEGVASMGGFNCVCGVVMEYTVYLRPKLSGAELDSMKARAKHD